MGTEPRSATRRARPGLRFALAELRAHSILVALGAVAGLLVVLVPLSTRLVPIPGLSEPIPGERLFPAALAAAAALVLPDRWALAERLGVRSVAALRAGRYAVALSLVLLGCLGAALSGVETPLLWLSLAALAAIATIMVALPRWWSVLVPVLLYVQVFAPDLDVVTGQVPFSAGLALGAGAISVWCPRGGTVPGSTGDADGA